MGTTTSIILAEKGWLEIEFDDLSVVSPRTHRYTLSQAKTVAESLRSLYMGIRSICWRADHASEPVAV